MKKRDANRNTGLSQIDRIEFDWIPDRKSGIPVYRQIAGYITEKIRRGDWVEGARLPAQRKLAEQLGVNRSTIVAAMDELLSYGILTCSRGGGTHISGSGWSLRLSQPPDWNKYIQDGHFQANKPTIQVINRIEYEEGYVRIGTGELAPELYPKDIIAKIMQKLPSRIPSLNYLGALGLPQLRSTLCDHLRRNHGIEANPENILITTGSLQALQLISICMTVDGGLAPDGAVVDDGESVCLVPDALQQVELRGFVTLDGKTYPCPISAAMDLVGGRWKPVIIYHLQDEPKRFSELRRDLVSATDATISIQLKQLENTGLVSRQVFGDKPPLRTVYSLTDFGRTFLPVLQVLTQWGNQVITERGQFA